MAAVLKGKRRATAKKGIHCTPVGSRVFKLAGFYPRKTTRAANASGHGLLSSTDFTVKLSRQASGGGLQNVVIEKSLFVCFFSARAPPTT
jgi:hypothetical protein